MSSSNLQKLARECNWARFQIKGIRSSLMHIAYQFGFPIWALELELDILEQKLKETYADRKEAIELLKIAEGE